MAQHVSDRRAPRMCPVHLNYVENQGMNFFAFEFKNYGFIGIYIGAVVTIYSLFGYLLSHPKFLTTMETPAKRKSGLLLIRTLDATAERPLESVLRSLLATLAIDFLFATKSGI